MGIKKTSINAWAVRLVLCLWLGFLAGCLKADLKITDQDLDK